MDESHERRQLIVETFDGQGKIQKIELLKSESVEVPAEWEVDWQVHLPANIKYVPPALKKTAVFPLANQNSQVPSQNRVMQDDIDHPDFDENDRWPRRLLDVDTMTSYKWEPGNSYGGVPTPRYSILSYTWGRWKIHDQNSIIKALDVNGVPWPIPKVKVEHFTAEQFEGVLHQVVSTSNKSLLLRRQRSNFIWVDIACIPQFEHSAVADSEVGRQARIFRGADVACVWLTTATSAHLERLVARRYSDRSDDVVSLFKEFCSILDDPWFSSMWTLQESFIQKEALVVTNSGICFEDPYKLKPLRLYHIRNLAERLLEHARIYGFTPDAQSDFALFKEAWTTTGLQEPRSNSPMQILASSQFRTCERDSDHVYGIMQVFGDEFRVGKARAQNPADRVAAYAMTLPQLEDELAGLVLKRFPLASQLFYHDDPPVAGRAWRICGRASVPARLAHASVMFEHEMDKQNAPLLAKSYCESSFQPSQQPLQRAVFEGKICPFDRIVECSKSQYFAPYASWFHVYIDAGLNVVSGSNSDVESVVEFFGREKLMLLLLSRMDDGVKDFSLSGLLLVSSGDVALACHKTRRQWHSGLDNMGRQTWARVGVCQMNWDEPESGGSDETRMEVRTLLGVSDEWRVQRGFLG